jgi:CHASE2 domain-containing sensor protein
MRPYRPFVFVAALITTVYLVGWFNFIDRGLLDARARLWSRPASGDLVIVAIDSASIRGAMALAAPLSRGGDRSAVGGGRQPDRL